MSSNHTLFLSILMYYDITIIYKDGRYRYFFLQCLLTHLKGILNRYIWFIQVFWKRNLFICSVYRYYPCTKIKWLFGCFFLNICFAFFLPLLKLNIYNPKMFTNYILSIFKKKLLDIHFKLNIEEVGDLVSK